MTEYRLIHAHGISANTLHRMRRGESVTTATIGVLCFLLNCPVSGIVEYVPPPPGGA